MSPSWKSIWSQGKNVAAVFVVHATNDNKGFVLCTLTWTEVNMMAYKDHSW